MSTATADRPLLWDAAEAAKRLSISPRTLWGLTKEGTIPAVRIGRLVRYSPAALETWIANQKGTGNAV